MTGKSSIECLDTLKQIALFEIEEFEEIRPFEEMYQKVKDDLVAYQSSFIVDRSKFYEIVDSVILYHSEDVEFCENFCEDIEKLIKKNFK